MQSHKTVSWVWSISDYKTEKSGCFWLQVHPVTFLTCQSTPPPQFCQLVCWSNFMSQEDKLGNDDHLFLIERNSLMIQMVCLRLLKKVDRYWKTMQIIFIAGIAFDVNCCLINLELISFPYGLEKSSMDWFSVCLLLYR